MRKAMWIIIGIISAWILKKRKNRKAKYSILKPSFTSKRNLTTKELSIIR